MRRRIFELSEPALCGHHVGAASGSWEQKAGDVMLVQARLQRRALSRRMAYHCLFWLANAKSKCTHRTDRREKGFWRKGRQCARLQCIVGRPPNALFLD